MNKLFKDFKKVSLNEWKKINQDLKNNDYNKNLLKN